MRLWFGFLLLGLLATLPSLTNAAQVAGSPVEINVVLALTGSGAFIGAGDRQALDALETYINKTGGIRGRPLKFAYFDNNSDPQVSVQFANQMIAKKVPAYLDGGPLSECIADAAITMKSGPTMYCLSPSLESPPGSFAFKSEVQVGDTIVTALQYFRSRGWTHISIITSTDGSGQVSERAFDAAMALPENKSMTVVDREHFGITDISVSAQVTRMENAKPDVIVAYATGTPIGTVLRQLRDAGNTVPVGTTSGNMSYAQMKQYSAFLPKDIFFPSPYFVAYSQLRGGPVKAAQAIFYRALADAGIDHPDNSQAVAWDPGVIVVRALQALGPDASSDAVRAWINSRTGFAGINGMYDFRNSPQRGLTAQDTIMARWDAAKQDFAPVSGATARQ